MKTITISKHATADDLAVGDSLVFACGYVPVCPEESPQWHLEYHPAVHGQVVEGQFDYGGAKAYLVKVNTGRRYAAYVSADMPHLIRFMDWRDFEQWRDQQEVA